MEWLQYNPSAFAAVEDLHSRGTLSACQLVHTDVNRTTMVQSAKFFGLLDRDASLMNLFNRVFHNFCEELCFRDGD
jgi:hypothetical protein